MTYQEIFDNIDEDVRFDLCLASSPGATQGRLERHPVMLEALKHVHEDEFVQACISKLLYYSSLPEEKPGYAHIDRYMIVAYCYILSHADNEIAKNLVKTIAGTQRQDWFDANFWLTRFHKPIAKTIEPEEFVLIIDSLGAYNLYQQAHHITLAHPLQ